MFATSSCIYYVPGDVVCADPSEEDSRGMQALRVRCTATWCTATYMLNSMKALYKCLYVPVLLRWSSK